MYAKNEKIYPTSYYFTDFKRERSHYLAVKKLSALLRGITLKINGDFHCLICFYSFKTATTTTTTKFESHKMYDLCNVLMPSEDHKILELNQCYEFD